jgi:hypothetical protein
MAAKKRRSAKKSRKAVGIVLGPAALRRLAEAVVALQALAMGVEMFIPIPSFRRELQKAKKKSKPTRRAKRRK